MAGEDTWWTAFSAGAAYVPACLQGTGATPASGGIVSLVTGGTRGGVAAAMRHGSLQEPEKGPAQPPPLCDYSLTTVLSLTDCSLTTGSSVCLTGLQPSSGHAHKPQLPARLLCRLKLWAPWSVNYNLTTGSSSLCLTTIQQSALKHNDSMKMSIHPSREVLVNKNSRELQLSEKLSLESPGSTLGQARVRGPGQLE